MKTSTPSSRPHAFDIARRQWPGVVAFALLFALITLVPYLYGWSQADEKSAFSGVISKFADACWHLSLAEQVRGGHFLVENKHGGGGTARILNGFALLGGLVSRATGLSPVVVLQGVRTASAFAVAVLAYWFAAPLLPGRRWRWVAMILAVTGAGFGWLFHPPEPHLRPIDVWWVESNLGWCLRWELIVAPTATALLLAFGLLDRAMRLGGWRRWIGAGIGAFVLSLIHPHDVSTLFGVTVLWVALSFVRLRIRKPAPGRRPRPWPGVLLVLVGGGPVFLYTVGQVVLGSSFRAYVGVEQEIRIIPLILGYGVLLVFAVVGSLAVVRRRESAGQVHAIWVGLAIVGLLLPWPRTQRIFLCHALTVPMAILAVRGLMAVALALKRKPSRALRVVGWVAVAVLVSVAALTNVKGYVADLRFVARGQWVDGRRPYLPRDWTDALNWLRANTDQHDLVAAVPNDGTLIAGFAGSRVYHGQRAATPQQKDRADLLRRFFEPGYPKELDGLRRGLVMMKADYVLFSDETPHEPTVSVLLQAQLIEHAYHNDLIAIYRVVRGDGPP